MTVSERPCEATDVTLVAEHVGLIGAAKAYRLYQGVQNGFEVDRGPADRLQHVAGRRLLVQRLAQLLEKTRVLDGNHSLVCECADERDLAVGETARSVPIYRKAANELIPLQQWNGDEAAYTADVDSQRSQFFPLAVCVIGDRVSHVYRSLGLDQLAEKGIRLGREGSIAHSLGVNRWQIPVRHHGEHLAITVEQDSELGFAQLRGLFEHGVEHRLQLAWRRIDDLQHLGGRRLPFQRLTLLGKQPCVFHRDHRLRGEVLQQRDLLVREGLDFPPVNRDCTQQ